jgi:hypothetical protein
MSLEYKDIVEKFDTDTALAVQEAKVCIMFLGPDLKTLGHASKLRACLIDTFKTETITIKGEHKELIAVHKRYLGTASDLCRVELDLAVRLIDGIVIIPYSAGSLVELGMFTFYPTICKKTLVLFSQEFNNPKEPSFIWSGTRQAYKLRGATIEFVDYSQTDSTINKVKEFITNIRALKYDANLVKFAAK